MNVSVEGECETRHSRADPPLISGPGPTPTPYGNTADVLPLQRKGDIDSEESGDNQEFTRRSQEFTRKSLVASDDCDEESEVVVEGCGKEY
jgi:hypothetical protein